MFDLLIFLKWCRRPTLFDECLLCYLASNYPYMYDVYAVLAISQTLMVYSIDVLLHSRYQAIADLLASELAGTFG